MIHSFILRALRRELGAGLGCLTLWFWSNGFLGSVFCLFLQEVSSEVETRAALVSLYEFSGLNAILRKWSLGPPNFQLIPLIGNALETSPVSTVDSPLSVHRLFVSFVALLRESRSKTEKKEREKKNPS